MDLDEGLEQMAPPVGYDLNANVAGGIKKVNWTQLDMIDFMLQNPFAKQSEVAARYGYTQPWVSRIIHSDAFKNKFLERKKEVCGPDFIAAMQEADEKTRALAADSLDRLHSRLASMDTDQLLKTAEFAAKAQGIGGYGAKSATVNVQTSFVVALPTKAATAEEWIANHARKPQLPEAAGSTIEAEIVRK